jgi:hypothetical protein
MEMKCRGQQTHWFGSHQIFNAAMQEQPPAVPLNFTQTHFPNLFAGPFPPCSLRENMINRQDLAKDINHYIIPVSKMFKPRRVGLSWPKTTPHFFLMWILRFDSCVKILTTWMI